MASHDVDNPHVIGLTGSFGSGCTYIGQNILRDRRNYEFLSLSEHVLKPLFHKETGKDPSQAARRELQVFGDGIRRDRDPGFFAEQIIEMIQAKTSTTGERSGWVVDSIRNPAEVRVLRRFSRSFFLFGVYADKEKRWERVKTKYKDNQRDFDEDDKNDTGEDNTGFGQHVGDCFYEADIVVTNDTHVETIGNADFKSLEGQIGQYVELVQSPLSRQKPICADESLMAAAYALSQRSSCRKRKVGAVISDAVGNIISSGYNEVPANERPCTEEYTTCYRDRLVDDFMAALGQMIGEVQQKSADVKGLFRKQFKILDYCRALHAEENAIVSLARNGRSVPLEECVLYTTTYPCRMCANKIANVGIKEIVYLEPYPDQRAKVILKQADVKDRFFKGVTFKAYSRLYGEEK